VAHEGLLELFPQNYHEPYYKSCTSEDFRALATSCGLTHIRDVKAFVSKVMVFDKPAVARFFRGLPGPCLEHSLEHFN
jgi:hypothetical protein